MRRSKVYEKGILASPMIAVVLEDNVWPYGEEKLKAKINIPSLMPAQELPKKIVSFKEKTTALVEPVSIKHTQNFIEIFLPDELYTYPSENMEKNPSQSLFGAKSGHALDDGTNGKYKKGLVRRVDKETKLVIIVVGGRVREENIKVLFKYDDYEEESKHGGKSDATR